MNLHHWIVSTNNNIKSFYSNPLLNQIELAEELYFRYGNLVRAQCLVNPLIFGLTNNQQNKINNNFLLDKCVVNLTLSNDLSGVSKTLHKESDFTALLIFHDFAQQISILTEEIGWSFISFHKSINPGGLIIVLKSSFIKSIDLLRGMILLRACLEILSCERGFVLYKCIIQNQKVEIDLLGNILDKFVG